MTRPWRAMLGGFVAVLFAGAGFLSYQWSIGDVPTDPEADGRTLLAAKLEGCRMVRPLGIIHRRQHQPGPATQGFIEMLRATDSSPNSNGDVA